MNYSTPTRVFATLSICLFSFSCFAQDARLYDLSEFKAFDHELNSNDTLELDREWLAWIERQAPHVGPPVPGPGPFLPRTDVEELLNYENMVMMDQLKSGGSDVQHGWEEISNGFIKLDGIDGDVSSLIDIEDYISKGGEDMMSDAVLMAYRQGHRGESGREVGTYPWTEEELAVLIFPPNDNDIDPKTGLLNPPWGDDGIIDQEKELPSDDDRSEHPGDK